MDEKDIANTVIDIIKEINPDIENSELENLDYDTRLRDQIELDSMDFLDIVMELRKKYGVEVPEEDYMKLSTMNGCVEYLREPLKDQKYNQ